MLQYLAQGASMAMEDAVCLAQKLGAADGDCKKAFVDYQQARYLRTARVIERAPGELVTFLDLTEIPPGVTVGRHTHGPDDEEIYVVVEGTGVVELDGREHEVGPGDVVVNAPGGTHALRATGERPLRMVVVDVARRAAPPS
jgi:mannose-6-phosphate isomerase-like protein (cupin superfamily)